MKGQNRTEFILEGYGSVNDAMSALCQEMNVYKREMSDDKKEQNVYKEK